MHNDTIDLYKEKIKEIEIKIDGFDAKINRTKERIDGIKDIIKIEPTGTGTNSQGEVVWNLRGVDYTMDELIRIHKISMSELESQDEYNKLIKEKDKLITILADLEEFTDGGWEFEEWALNSDDADIEFSDDVYSEEYMFDGLYSNVNFNDLSYEPYFDFVDNYMDIEVDMYDIRMSFYDSSYEIIYNDESPDGESILDELDLPHPDEGHIENR